MIFMWVKNKKSSACSVFTRYVARTGWRAHAKILGYYVKELYDADCISGRFLIMDSKAIELCPICKHVKGCPYLKGKRNKEGNLYLPNYCLARQYEWDKPIYKSKNKRTMGAKKHTIIDLNPGTGELTTIAEIIPPVM